MTDSEGADFFAAVKTAYIDPIRNVLLIDDRFRTFGQLARKAEPGTADKDVPYEDEAAAKLWEACRTRGWNCDVENAVGIAAGAADETRLRIQKSDLLVLDYHLEGQDPSHSIRILRELSASPGASLVILYTVDPDLDKVRRTVAAALRGAAAPEDQLGSDSEAVDAWQNLPEDVPEFSAQHVDSYLRGDSSFKKDAGLRGQLEEAKVPKPRQTGILNAAMEHYLIKKLGAARLATPYSIQMSAHGASPGWVCRDNVFVVFVSKSVSGAEVFELLSLALRDWKPSPLHITAAYARHAIAQGGIRLDADVLSDARLRAGWIHHALEEEPTRGLRNLYERLVGSMTEAVVDKVAGFGAALITAASAADQQQSNLQRARAMAALPESPKMDDSAIVAALNGFLCSETFRGLHVRTGTVFARADQAQPETYWICVTPACDMVPREAGAERWERDLHPLRPMTVLRAKKVRLQSALSFATDGRHAFFATPEGSVAVEALDQNRHPLTEMMVVENLARTDSEGCFFLYRIQRASDNEQPSVGERIKMRAVAQLRPTYAGRLLQETGGYVSRIGTDFVKLGERKS